MYALFSGLWQQAGGVRLRQPGRGQRHPILSDWKCGPCFHICEWCEHRIKYVKECSLGGPYEGQPDGGQLAASQRQRPILGLN